jgi:hypothetical protein
MLQEVLYGSGTPKLCKSMRNIEKNYTTMDKKNGILKVANGITSTYVPSVHCSTSHQGHLSAA